MRKLLTLASLLGVTLYQAFRYARAFPGDPLWIKILVRQCSNML